MDDELLTERQIEALQLLADGHSSQQAARRMGISTRTYNNHLGNCNQRLGVKMQVHAVLEAIRLGLVEFPVPRQPDRRYRRR